MTSGTPSTPAPGGDPCPGETRVEIAIPLARELDDAGLERWFPNRDGKWSRQTKALVERFGATGLDLNANWAETSPGWACSCCGRTKPEIVRLTAGGVLLAHLHVHHDHLRDHLSARIDARIGTPWPKDLNRSSGPADEHVRALAVRFRQTVVCDGCNTADGEAKRALGDVVHRHFSFSPSEIARFVRPRPNAPHGVDVEAARGIWLAAKPVFEDRLGFIDIMVERLAAGLLAVERDVNAVPRHNISAVEAYVMREAPRQPAVHELRALESGLRLALRERSLSRDGVGRSARPRKAGRTRAPTEAEVAAFEAKAPKSWTAEPADWSCPCCGREKRAILRLAGSGRWFGQVRDHFESVPEDDPGNLAYRRALYPGHRAAPMIGARLHLRLCSDCGDVWSDLKRTRPDLGSFTLTPDDVRACLVEVRENEKTPIDLDEAARRAMANRELGQAESDFSEHRSLALTAWGVFLQYAPDQRDAAHAALLRVAGHAGIDPDAAPGGLGWLLRQGKAFQGEYETPDP